MLMKRKTYLICAMLAAAFTLSSCGDDNDDANTTQTVTYNIEYMLDDETKLFALEKASGEAWITYDPSNPLHLNSSNAAKISTYTGALVIPDTIEAKNGNKYCITGVDEMAFANNNELTSLVLPDSVKSFGDGAFCNCVALTTVNVPEGIVTIPKACFGQCKKIKELTLPSTVTSIGRLAFYNCSSLKKLHVKATTPPAVDEAAFDANLAKNVTIYVPAGSKALYEEHEIWKQSKAITEE